MKNLTVYYSWTGNTEVVAKELHSLVGGDLRKIEEKKRRKGGAGFAGAALSALLGLKSKLEPLDISAEDYDDIYIGTPVWASHSAPAVNSFISGCRLQGKKVHLFITLADDKFPQKVVDSLTQRIEKRGGSVVGSIAVRTKMNSVISAAYARESISKWA